MTGNQLSYSNYTLNFWPSQTLASFLCSLLSVSCVMILPWCLLLLCGQQYFKISRKAFIMEIHTITGSFIKSIMEGLESSQALSRLLQDWCNEAKQKQSRLVSWSAWMALQCGLQPTTLVGQLTLIACAQWEESQSTQRRIQVFQAEFKPMNLWNILVCGNKCKPLCYMRAHEARGKKKSKVG